MCQTVIFFSRHVRVPPIRCTPIKCSAVVVMADVRLFMPRRRGGRGVVGGGGRLQFPKQWGRQNTLLHAQLRLFVLNLLLKADIYMCCVIIPFQYRPQQRTRGAPVEGGRMELRLRCRWSYRQALHYFNGTNWKYLTVQAMWCFSVPSPTFSPSDVTTSYYLLGPPLYNETCIPPVTMM